MIRCCGWWGEAVQIYLYCADGLGVIMWQSRVDRGGAKDGFEERPEEIISVVK
jgi:hypothetical protein